MFKWEQTKQQKIHSLKAEDKENMYINSLQFKPTVNKKSSIIAANGKSEKDRQSVYERLYAQKHKKDTVSEGNPPFAISKGYQANKELVKIS